MKTLVFVVAVMIASAVFGAEAPKETPVEVLQLQITNLDLTMKNMELNYENLKRARESMAAELDSRLKAAAPKPAAEKKAPTATKP